ncbi:winged helix-turn-helix domain-containing protein [Piscirickettsia salmonis]|uniref:winged helix-turn-helix domain-containing protein n=1 Tax=Piscirickettsia salmonis TaxID=1238 RepID=UPI00094A45B6|nr:winged helix-turn-helix domain-containing protein [Piscirickettsia salmonis]APS75122.1 hypothetical protein AVM70_16235 [Piscirickettsia salmonis]
MDIDPKITAKEVASFLGLTVQAVHKRIKVKGAKEKKAQNRIYFGHDTAREIIEPKVKQFKIATAVVKGGVGKTTLAGRWLFVPLYTDLEFYVSILTSKQI